MDKVVGTPTTPLATPELSYLLEIILKGGMFGEMSWRAILI